MSTGQSIVTSSLLISWALLLSARTIAAAIYASVPSQPYELGLEHIGWVLPAFAWLCFTAGVFAFLWFSGYVGQNVRQNGTGTPSRESPR